ncbi:hypothetical protein BJP36_43465 [Moorena producens JHB]|uniref:Uncharacterized protein n=1 Tax=Moorena producens (strain JHB) TaxID=1454205 RepID=A0A9Q9ST78_MOOP1|nr:hypothetical protein [Moorena producens]WAN69220.1 hypothetical protein BJP36_43465 [Moorena producens JHB]
MRKTRLSALSIIFFPVPCSLFPVPCSLFPIPCSPQLPQSLIITNGA